MEKSKKIGIVFVRASPIMETLTGIMIAVLIFYSGSHCSISEGTSGGLRHCSLLSQSLGVSAWLSS